jgi:tetratricopeptide (TPR) repeat protein
MPATSYSIFLASPSDLQNERKVVREVIAEFNNRPVSQKILFSAVGYEAMSRGLGNPEDRILSDLRNCDYLILLLGARWGVPPGGSAEYTSGTEAEFYEAISCYNNNSLPMRGMAVFFRALSPQLLADPGPQLLRVLEFRKHLEETQQIFYGDFDELQSLRTRVETQLASWVAEAASGPKHVSVPVRIFRPATTPAVTAPAEGTDSAEEHLRAGRFTDAEMIFARITAEESDLSAMIAYGRFLMNHGRFAQAYGMFTRVMELARLQRNIEMEALALDNNARILRRKNELLAAAELNQRAIELYKKLGGDAGRLGEARQLGQLGLVYRLQEDLDKAIAHHDAAERIFIEYLSLPDLAMQHGAKGKVFQDRAERALARGEVEAAQHDLAAAENLFKKALAAAEQLRLSKDMAINYGHLTRNHLIRVELDKARVTLAKCQQFNQETGNKWGLATCMFYQGWLDLRRGDRSSAKAHLGRAVEAYKRMGIQRDEEDAQRLLRELESTASVAGGQATESA